MPSPWGRWHGKAVTDEGNSRMFSTPHQSAMLTASLKEKPFNAFFPIDRSMGSFYRKKAPAFARAENIRLFQRKIVDFRRDI